MHASLAIAALGAPAVLSYLLWKTRVWWLGAFLALFAAVVVLVACAPTPAPEESCGHDQPAMMCFDGLEHVINDAGYFGLVAVLAGYAFALRSVTLGARERADRAAKAPAALPRAQIR
jgi:hypothetical protein